MNGFSLEAFLYWHDVVDGVYHDLERWPGGVLQDHLSGRHVLGVVNEEHVPKHLAHQSQNCLVSCHLATIPVLELKCDVRRNLGDGGIVDECGIHNVTLL